MMKDPGVRARAAHVDRQVYVRPAMLLKPQKSPGWDEEFAAADDAIKEKEKEEKEVTDKEAEEERKEEVKEQRAADSEMRRERKERVQEAIERMKDEKKALEEAEGAFRSNEPQPWDAEKKHERKALVCVYDLSLSLCLYYQSLSISVSTTEHSRIYLHVCRQLCVFACGVTHACTHAIILHAYSILLTVQL